MPSTKTMIVSLVSALAFLEGALAGQLKVKNNLPYTVYVKAVRGAERGDVDDSPIYPCEPYSKPFSVPDWKKYSAWPGKVSAQATGLPTTFLTYLCPNADRNLLTNNHQDEAAITYKVSPYPDCSEHYQFQVNVDKDPITWYQLSAQNGDPFDGEKVGMGIWGEPDCDWETCGPYEDEEPTHKCETDKDVYLYLGSYS